MTLESILSSIKHFFKTLFSDSPDVSSKRVVGFEMAQVIVLEVIWHLTTKQVVQTELIAIPAALVAACFGLSSYFGAKVESKTKEE